MAASSDNLLCHSLWRLANTRLRDEDVPAACHAFAAALESAVDHSVIRMRILVQYISVLIAKTTSYELIEEQFEIGMMLIEEGAHMELDVMMTFLFLRCQHFASRLQNQQLKKAYEDAVHHAERVSEWSWFYYLQSMRIKHLRGVKQDFHLHQAASIALSASKVAGLHNHHDAHVKLLLQYVQIQMQLNERLAATDGINQCDKVLQSMAEYNQVPQQPQSVQKLWELSCLRIQCDLMRVVCNVQSGHLKDAEDTLKRVHVDLATIQSLHSATTERPNAADWLDAKRLFATVYLMSAWTKLATDHMSARQYLEKGLELVDATDSDTTTLCLRFLLLNLSCLLSLSRCELASGIAVVSDMIRLCNASSELHERYRATVHISLAHLCVRLGQPPLGLRHLRVASTYSQTLETSLTIEIMTALTHLRATEPEITSQNLNELVAALQKKFEDIPKDTLSAEVLCSFDLLQGEHFLSCGQLGPAKDRLRASLHLSNGIVQNSQLSANSLALLGNIFLRVSKESQAKDMLTSSILLATKLHDVHIQVQAVAVLQTIYHNRGDSEKAQANAKYRRKKLEQITIAVQAVLQDPLTQQIVEWDLM
eukprot:GILJ01011117.1.p1 GENE.GILJ01011117.1~~GILJ01011117.1.p1  ORF type:complete len:595 (+),score=60.07 GILJ01011117.1:163-1947(+)